MFCIKKEYTFDAAHMLKGHFGKCKNLHGHTYKLICYFKTDKLNTDGSDRDMVIDFYHVNEIVKPLINEIDHSFICDTTDPTQMAILNLLSKSDKKIYQIPFRSTSENLAKHFYQLIKQDLKMLYKVELFETATSMCAYVESVGND